VAEGRVGSVWRLDTELGSWAVTPVAGDLRPGAQSALEETTGSLERLVYGSGAGGRSPGLPSPPGSCARLTIP